MRSYKPKMPDDKLLNITQAYNSIFSILDFSQQRLFPLSFFLSMPFRDELRNKKYCWDYISAENRERIWQRNGVLFPFLSLQNVSTFKSVYPKNHSWTERQQFTPFIPVLCKNILFLVDKVMTHVLEWKDIGSSGRMGKGEEELCSSGVGVGTSTV